MSWVTGIPRVADDFADLRSCVRVCLEEAVLELIDLVKSSHNRFCCVSCTGSCAGSRFGMAVQRGWRRVLTYVRQDLREIFIPTSLPDPPEYVQPRRLSWRERIEVRGARALVKSCLRQSLISDAPAKALR